jgi:hypothetical protein
MYITKREFNAIKTLKRFLSKSEWHDFKGLLNKNVSYVEVEIDNNITINFFDNDYNKKLAYSMIVERTLGFKAFYKLNIKKSSLCLIERYILNNDLALRMVKKLKSDNYITIELNYKRIGFEIGRGFYYLPIEIKPKLRIMRLKE